MNLKIRKIIILLLNYHGVLLQTNMVHGMENLKLAYFVINGSSSPVIGTRYKRGLIESYLGDLFPEKKLNRFL